MPSRSPSARQLVAALFLCALALSACKRIEKDLPPAVTKAVAAVKQKYCPDQRLCVFDVQVQIRGANLKLMGELSDAAARSELLQAVKAAMPDFKVEDEIRFLPDEALPANERFGLVAVSVANLRSKPAHAAELALQQLMGSSVAILKKEGTWYYVQTEDQYLAWIPIGALLVGRQNLIAAWRAADLVAIKNMHGLVRTEARADANPLSTVVLGNVLRRLPEAAASSNTKSKWLAVVLPDGRQGFIESELVASTRELYPQTQTSPATVVAHAQRMLGVPYLWGGTSVSGFDCSGLTQTVFRLSGVKLLRDASQQARQGVPLAVGKDYAELQPGDLLFFGEKENRITHVAISLGGPRFMHASDFVRSNSLDENDADYVEYRRKTFQFAKRFFNATN
ncbi:MAG: C40 family peptidase [candidate division KSB1 bacterium]